MHLAFWLDRARRLRRCESRWASLDGQYGLNVRCRLRVIHPGRQHESVFGTRWN